MQAVLTTPTAFDPASRLHGFARGHDYMMRSEKRPGHGPSTGNNSGKRPPKRRRRRAGFFYKLLTLLLLLTIWPVGLLLLWRRRLRWGALTKLLTSIVTLAACIILIGFALTVNTGNARYTAVQDKVNGFLDTAADWVVEASGVVADRAGLVYEDARNLGDALWEKAKPELANAIDSGIVLTQRAKTGVEQLIERLKGDSTDATATPEIEASASPAPEDSAAPAGSPSASPTPRPTVEVRVNEGDESIPIYIPEVTPETGSGETVTAGTLLRSGVLNAGALPTASSTPEPTPEITEFEVKPAAEAIVYYNQGSGKYYHMTTQCGSMKTADAHTLGETADSNVQACNVCNTPDKALLDEKYIVWTDESNAAHLSDACAAFEGAWNLSSAENALAEGLEGCETCGADRYLAQIAAGTEPVVIAPSAAAEPSAEPTATAEPSATAAPTATPTATPSPTPSATPTPSPTPTATPAPTPRIVTPATPLKAAGEATVYHTSNGKWYHMHTTCKNMTNAKPYTLAECAGSYKRCNTCAAPLPELVGKHCLWRDETGLCHTSDECAAFTGDYTLVLRDDALANGFAACTDCGADEYLIPDSIIHYAD